MKEGTLAVMGGWLYMTKQINILRMMRARFLLLQEEFTNMEKEKNRISLLVLDSTLIHELVVFQIDMLSSSIKRTWE